MDESLYIGVGCLPAQALPFEVLKYSLEVHSSRPLRVEPLHATGVAIPEPRDPAQRQKTPFSFQRFIIPEVRAYSGKAMYLDSDMLVFGDVAPLFELEFGDANVLAVPREFSVILLDCNRLDWNIRTLVDALDGGRLSYDGLMTGRSVSRVQYSLPPGWNWLDNAGGNVPADVSLLHYTVTSSQPWLTSGHPQGHRWVESLMEAIEAGAIARGFVHEQVERGYVRPSLIYQIEQGVASGRQLPPEVKAGDQPFATYCQSVNHAIVEGFKSKIG